MTTLKTLRNRTKSVKSTQKITLAMKMVAGAKLRRASEQVEAGRPYARLIRQILTDLAANTQALEISQPLLMGTGKKEKHLILVMTSDRGLCGAFNASIIRRARQLIASCQEQGQTVKLCCVGRKGNGMLERDYGSLIIESFTDIGYPRLRFSDAQRISDSLLNMFNDGVFDICTLLYNHFKSALNQETTAQQIIPLEIEKADVQPFFSKAIYEYEPSEHTILSRLLPQNVTMQVYSALLENIASEEGARMTAMDSANRNADDMIRKLSLTYNRTRQTHITRELIEIISGAETLA